MPFITPITDRTASDVAYALANQNSVSDLKGAFNISDANRIIDNTVFLRNLLNTEGYFPKIVAQNHFTENDLPHLTSKINVMRSNVLAVVNSFFKRSHPSIYMGNTLDHVMLNNIEMNLYITNNMLEALIAELRYSGTFNSGESQLL